MPLSSEMRHAGQLLQRQQCYNGTLLQPAAPHPAQDPPSRPHSSSAAQHWLHFAALYLFHAARLATPTPPTATPPTQPTQPTAAHFHCILQLYCACICHIYTVKPAALARNQPLPLPLPLCTLFFLPDPYFACIHSTLFALHLVLCFLFNFTF